MSTTIRPPHLQPPAPPSPPAAASHPDLIVLVRKLPQRATGVVRRLGWKLSVLLAGAAVLVLGWLIYAWMTGGSGATAEITATVARADLPVTVSERGELERSHTIDVRCEGEGYQNKLITILPEGKHVTKGEIVAAFDVDQINRTLLEQEVKYKTAVGKADAAEGELEVQKQ